MSEREVAAVQALATRQIEKILSEALAGGWDFAAVSLWRRLESHEGGGGAGASTFDVRRSVMPALPRIADNLRVLADQLDALHRESGAREIIEGYTHVISRKEL